MMTLLSEEYRKCIAVFDKDIDAIYAKLLPFKDLPSFKEHEERIRIHLNQTSQEKLVTKDKKFWRDKRAFQEGKANKWHQNSPINRSQKGNLGQNLKDLASNSSLNSSVSSSSQYRHRNRKPQKTKRSSSGKDPSLNKKRITDHTSTQQSPLLSSIGKGISRGANLPLSIGPSGIGSSSTTHIGDLPCASTSVTLSKTDKDFLVHRMEESPPDT